MSAPAGDIYGIDWGLGDRGALVRVDFHTNPPTYTDITPVADKQTAQVTGPSQK